MISLRTFKKRAHSSQKLLLAMTVSLIVSIPIAIPEAKAEGFIDDSHLGGGIYFWQRQRDRKDIPNGGEYKDNLHHATWNTNLDFTSGYYSDIVGLDLGVYGSIEMNDGGPAYPNEIGFSTHKTRWNDIGQENGDASGVSFYKAALKFKLGSGYWLKAGYIQPSGQTLLRPHWSFMPGTYRGAEIGGKYDLGDSEELAFSYMLADQYKAPWYRTMYNFRMADDKTDVSYLHSLGLSYKMNNGVKLEGAYGQAKSYMDQFVVKGTYTTKLANNPLSSSYQFYGAKDSHHGNTVNNVYSGLAWLQALVFNLETGPFAWRLEGTWVEAKGSQGYFLQRMTKRNATSNGWLDVDWNARSDFNAHGEKSVYAGVMYNLAGWQLPDWSAGTAYVYGWGAKPSKTSSNTGSIEESAWTFDINYVVPEGRAKNTKFAVHYTVYDNHSKIPSWGGGYNNIFQDEKDLKFIVTVPFSFF